MAGIRPGKCYRRVERAFTRVSIRRPRQSYVKGVPKHKIAGFEFGQKGNYSKVVYLISKRALQIRHNSLEAARIMAIKEMERKLKEGFFFKLRVFPHQILRENPLATGAGADRFQQGMRKSFGIPIGTAAIVREGQKIMEIRTNEVNIPIVRKAFKSAMFKLPTPCRVVVEDLK